MQSINARSWREYKDLIVNAGVVKHKGKKTKRKIVDLVCAFDIETTSVKSLEQSIMYIWQFAIEDRVYFGRTWDEFRIFVARLCREIGSRTLVVYVHNLSFEFQFLKTVFKFETVFALSTRKVAKAIIDGGQIEFRCSYVQTNMSLEDFTYKMDVEHKKLIGYDYEGERWPWTELTEQEIAYCANDVLGLVEALKKEMAADGDDLLTIPMTSTGYVRRDMRQSLEAYGTRVDRLLPDEHLYHLLRWAFRGGNTHANRWYAGAILENVHSLDRSSSYPDVMVNCDYPIKPFKRVKYSKALKGKPYLIVVKFDNIRLKREWEPVPYISYAKVMQIEKPSGEWLDNGRVLYADSVTLCITDVDMCIIQKQYIWDSMYVSECYVSEYGKLPYSVREVVLDYYKKKTTLKGVEGQETYYMKSKNKLNSCYGMMAQDPGKDEVVFDGIVLALAGKDIPDLLEEYYNRAFKLPYQWGVWVTAHARKALQDGIDAVGEDCIYVDTDSVKYVGDHDTDLEALNDTFKIRSENNSAYADDRKGKRHYMGVYEREHDYDRFRTWGAKKYAYEIDGELDATIAGVSKKSFRDPAKWYGARELASAGGLEAFKPGFVFRKSAGIEAKYNDCIAHKIEVEGKEVEVTSNVYFSPSTYTLSLGRDYAALLNYIWSGLKG